MDTNMVIPTGIAAVTLTVEINIYLKQFANFLLESIFSVE